MDLKTSEPPPIACTLDAGEFRARLAWIAELNAAALRSAHRDGLRLELVYAPEAASEVRELVRREQACCAFLTLRLTETASALHLVIAAPEAAEAAAGLIFEQFQTKAAASSACGCCGAVR